MITQKSERSWEIADEYEAAINGEHRECYETDGECAAIDDILLRLREVAALPPGFFQDVPVGLDCVSCGRRATHFNEVEIERSPRCEYHRTFSDAPGLTPEQQGEAHDLRRELLDQGGNTTNMSAFELLSCFRQNENGVLVRWRV